MQLIIDLDDQILTDFYQSVGANPVAEWTQEEKDIWLRINFLEPFIYKCLIEEGKYARKQTAQIAIMEEYNLAEKVIDDKITEINLSKQLELPEKLRTITEVIKEPIVVIDPTKVIK